MSTWQPIETAPKDGTTVLLAVENEDEPVCSGSFDAENIPGWFGQYGELRPTHWMPLPDPPRLEGR